MKEETRCRHMGYSFRLTARVLLYASSHIQDNTYHGLCYTSRGTLAGRRNTSMGPPHEESIRRPIARSYHGATSRSQMFVILYTHTHTHTHTHTPSQRSISARKSNAETYNDINSSLCHFQEDIYLGVSLPNINAYVVFMYKNTKCIKRSAQRQKHSHFHILYKHITIT